MASKKGRAHTASRSDESAETRRLLAKVLQEGPKCLDRLSEAATLDYQKLERELNQFRAGSLVAEGSALWGLMKAFEARIFHGKNALAELSNAGVPAWLPLFGFWLYWIHVSLSKTPFGQFRDPGVWLRLAEKAEHLAIRLEQTPRFFTAPEKSPDTEGLISALREWTRKLRVSAYSRTDNHLILTTTPQVDGSIVVGLIVGPRRKQQLNIPGNKTPSFEIDPSFWAWLVSHWIRTRTGKPHWKCLAEVTRIFLNLKSTQLDLRKSTTSGEVLTEKDRMTTRIKNLQQRIRDSVAGYDMQELKRAADLIAEAAKQQFVPHQKIPD